VQKFATQVDEEVLRQVRETARETGQTISRLVEDALVEHLRRIRVRPVVREAIDEVLEDHEETLRRLAR